jgi:Kef-type K+ transport system membrane component KefB
MVDSGSIHAIELVFLLLLFVVVFRFLAQRLRLPYSIISVIAGTLLGFVPGTPRIKRDRDVAFFAVLRVTIHQNRSCFFNA